MKIVKAASAINAAIMPADGFVDGVVATDVTLSVDYISKARRPAGLCATAGGYLQQLAAKEAGLEAAADPRRISSAVLRSSDLLHNSPFAGANFDLGRS
jgi:hypothetical protein